MHPPRTSEGNGSILILIGPRCQEHRSYVSNNEMEHFFNSRYKLQYIFVLENWPWFLVRCVLSVNRGPAARLAATDDVK